MAERQPVKVIGSYRSSAGLPRLTIVYNLPFVSIFDYIRDWICGQLGCYFTTVQALLSPFLYHFVPFFLKRQQLIQ